MSHCDLTIVCAELHYREKPIIMTILFENIRSLPPNHAFAGYKSSQRSITDKSVRLCDEISEIIT